ncbi:MAG TPA: HEAT repeat domain-containing protein, partial [Polyangiaceae bacterium]|nr:HEAT repeat domain-containing protein [Polyangiaceae bacterium]
ALRARAFGLLPEPLVAELRGLAARWLADNDPALLGAALRALPWLPEPLALAARHATSPDPMIRRALALALGGVRDPGAHAALAHLAERDPVPYVRMAAVWALASRPDCDVALLYRIARDGEDARVRDAAIEKLIGRQPGAAAPLVEAALRESGSAGGTLLEKLFAAPPHPAVEALARRIVASSARQLERLNHRAPELAVGYLVDRGAYDAAPAIRNLLAARYIGARTAAAAAAARLGDRAAVAPLEAMLRDENDYARIAAAEALAALGSRASATKIEAAARDVSEWALPAIEAALVALRAAGPKP